MRWIILAFVIGAVFVAANGARNAAAGPEGPPAVFGDADCGGSVDVVDALATLRFVAQLQPQAPCVQFADVNCDGSVDVVDALEILRFVASLPRGPSGPGCPAIGSPALVEELPPLDFVVNSAIQPAQDEIPGREGEPPRPVAALVDEDGMRTEFVTNELIIVTDSDAELSAFLARWQGELLATLDPADAGIEGVPRIHLVRANVDAANTAALADNLRQLDENLWGDFQVSSQDGLELLAAAAVENASGRQVLVNPVFEGSDLDQRMIAEAPSGQNPYTPNPFDWPYMNRGGNQDIGVAEAWRALNAAGRLGNKVEIAILDGGFAPNADFPSGFRMLGPANTPNPASCTAGSACPWHGTTVTAAAMGVVNNGFGVAGPAGPVAQAILVQSPSISLTEIIEYVFINIPATGFIRPHIINISAGVAIPREVCLLGICTLMDLLSRGIRALDILVFAAAGNEGRNVDEERCINLLLGSICYEKRVHIPCELDKIICVGGLAWDSASRHPNSNYGTNTSNTVDIYGPYVQFRTPTPDAPGNPTWGPCGTSCATPFVAGVAALIKAANISLGADGIEQRMMETAHRNGPDPRVNRWVNAYRAVIQTLGGNQAPDIQIFVPSEGATIFGGIPAELQAFVTDPEDRPTLGHPYTGRPEVRWTSSLQGNLGTGPLISTVLAFGEHLITATAIDSSGFRISDTAMITVINPPPQVNISAPLDGSIFHAGEVITFRATSLDLNELTFRLSDAQMEWFAAPVANPANRTSLGNGHTLEASIPLQGDYVITLRGTDSHGAFAEASITLQITPPPPDLPPSVKILSPENNFVVGCQPANTVDLLGQATDPEDGPLTGDSLVWEMITMAGTTFLGTGEMLNDVVIVEGLQEGFFTFSIRLTATDSQGASRSDSVSGTYACIT